MRTQKTQQGSATITTFGHSFNSGAAQDASLPYVSVSPAASALQDRRDALVMEHLPTVRFIARRISKHLPQHVEMEDLVSAGLVGLLDAASRFDSSKQVQFKSYAQFRIRGAIVDSLRTLDWSPRELRRQGRELQEAIRSLSIKLGRTPTEVEVSEEMGLSLAVLHQLTGELKNLTVSSLDADLDEGEGDPEVSSVPAGSGYDPLLRCIAGENRERLAAAIDLLPERERLVLTLSYFEEMTLKEIGATLGVVESRVSQLRSAAITRLRSHLRPRVRRQQTKSNEC